MEPVRLGRTGLEVSRIWLGMLSYGTPGWRGWNWILSADEAAPFVKRALELGITTFDTADMYSAGVSEEVTGQLLRRHAHRESVVIATKVFHPIRDGANAGGLSRAHIMEAIDASLRRLDTDYVDLYQIHRFDPHTPVEETMEALHDVVRAGKARYIGASSMHAWQFAKMQHVADVGGWTRFIAMQPHYNLLYREEEREMLPLCADTGVGVMPWSPLARGRLARAPDEAEATDRGRQDHRGRELYEQAETETMRRVGDIAAQLGYSRAQIAMAWLLHKSVVTAPIVGVTSLEHLDEAADAVDITLSNEAIESLEAHYRPRPVLGHR